MSRAAPMAAAWSVRTYRAPAKAAASAASCSSRRSTSIMPTSNASAAIRRSATRPPAKRTRICPRSWGRLVIDDKGRLRCDRDGRKGVEWKQRRIRVAGRDGHHGASRVVTVPVGSVVAGRVPPTSVDRDTRTRHPPACLSHPADDVVPSGVAPGRPGRGRAARASERVRTVDDRVASTLAGRVTETLVVEDEPACFDDPEQEQEEERNDQGELDESLTS